MIQGAIQHLRDTDWREMEEQIIEALYKIVFAGPVALVREADPDTAKVLQVMNAQPTVLEKALISGRVQYVGGVFSGKFSAQIAAEIRILGGRFDKRMKIYHIDERVVPSWVKAAATNFRAKAKALHEQIIKKLDETQKHLDELIERVRIDATKTVEKVESGFQKSAQAVPRVFPRLTEESKKLLAKEYNENMKTYIKGFSESAIESLRETVQENAESGARFKSLIEGFRLRYGVSKSKAAFLAQQETSNFMAKYRELRFKEGGVQRYVWHTAHDEKVRHRHAELDGKIFFYDHPPIVTDHGVVPVRHGNPGQDFRCRCVDAPVIERELVAA